MLYTPGCLTKDDRASYLSSTDCGLSWQIKYSHGKINSCVYLEKAGIYITAYDAHNNYIGIKKGLYVYRSAIGPDDDNPEVITLSDNENFGDTFLPAQSTFSDRIRCSSA